MSGFSTKDSRKYACGVCHQDLGTDDPEKVESILTDHYLEAKHPPIPRLLELA